MSSSRALCCLLSVGKQKHDFCYFLVQCIIKQLLVSFFLSTSVRVISLSLRLRLITFTSTLIILDVTKTSSTPPTSPGSPSLVGVQCHWYCGLQHNLNICSSQRLETRQVTKKVATSNFPFQWLAS